ncbi:hypothetical protein CPB83DRAFT_861067 [Crepidotus variabilis]|uniref:Uncharacterized protein n=1 Tax=Crepidotus variabilis TaxID=179855 RepID=A0A9P6E8N5_9AGAR|nr:hypothetical protein CPB83DRAFT_861067 [Crepidotus variabilis]
MDCPLTSSALNKPLILDFKQLIYLLQAETLKATDELLRVLKITLIKNLNGFRREWLLVQVIEPASRTVMYFRMERGLWPVTDTITRTDGKLNQSDVVMEELKFVGDLDSEENPRLADIAALATASEDLGIIYTLSPYHCYRFAGLVFGACATLPFKHVFLVHETRLKAGYFGWMSLVEIKEGEKRALARQFRPSHEARCPTAKKPSPKRSYQLRFP